MFCHSADRQVSPITEQSVIVTPSGVILNIVLTFHRHPCHLSSDVRYILHRVAPVSVSLTIVQSEEATCGSPQNGHTNLSACLFGMPMLPRLLLSCKP